MLGLQEATLSKSPEAFIKPSPKEAYPIDKRQKASITRVVQEAIVNTSLQESIINTGLQGE